MKKMHSLVLIALGLVSIDSYAAKCLQNCVGNRAGDVKVTAAGGEFFFASKRQIDNTALGMVILGYNFTDNWGIEGLLGGFSTDFKNAVHDNREISGTLFAIDGAYHFSPYYNVQPYVLAGVGVLGLNPNRYSANNEGNINAAIGAEFFIHPAVAFRIEGRDFYTWVGGKNDVMLDGGVTFLFDFC